MRYIYLVSRKSISGMTNWQQGTRFVTIRSNRVESTTFSTNPSKPRCAIFTKSRANRLPVWRINSKGPDSCRFDRIVSNRQHFQPTLKAQMRYIYLVSRKSISGMTNRQQGTRFVTIRLNHVESRTFATQPQSADVLYLLSRGNWLPVWRIDSKGTIRVDSIKSSRINNIFNPPFKAQMRYIY